jgi:hypothetical protein
MSNVVAATYRWNTSTAAEAFDAAAQFIHSLYLDIQDQILARQRIPHGNSARWILAD